MRWLEVISEDLDPVAMARNFIMDTLASLKAQGVQTITVAQLVDQLKSTPDFEGTAVEGDLISAALDGVQGFSIKPDPQTNELSVFIDNPTAGRQVDQKQAEKDDKSIKSAAMRSIAKNQSED